MDAKVKKIEQEAIETACEAKYCFNCRYSYIHECNDHGYCNYQETRTSTFPLVITEYHVCKHWKSKKKIKGKNGK